MAPAQHKSAFPDRETPPLTGIMAALVKSYGDDVIAPMLLPVVENIVAKENPFLNLQSETRE